MTVLIGLTGTAKPYTNPKIKQIYVFHMIQPRLQWFVHVEWMDNVIPDYQ